MKKTLVIFAHPYLERSNASKELINFYVRHQHYTLRDLYEEYPDFHIAAFRERKRLAKYDRIIIQFPITWFGIPPLLQLWLDEILDKNWLKEGELNPLENKEIFILLSTGGKESAFSKDGVYGYTIPEIISGLLVSLQVFKAVVKNISIVYEFHKLSKKDLILEKRKFVEIINQP